ncbi:group III truncated hemoglobin [Cyclobacterium jeungdonense]|uniref:Group III truncated hemoglobin n=1 Tax=Cyclobacterium jeungdonense TaxID=708087 RepID=A0ABT8CAM0_9BACT|nr:group III truncated hemoglobin [Cyclobacterium jeungdonense]MDN3688726.1 group III truncated hemoglobin [Cyclobacterium jeungdonense]
MMVKKEIETIEEIRELVDTFYDKVRRDPLLGPVFEKRIGDSWDVHLAKMYRFWQTVLLQEHTYHGSPFTPHATMPIGEEHFQRWLVLFKKTLEENFRGQKAEEAQWRAEKMAEMFQLKIAYYQDNHIHPIG